MLICGMEIKVMDEIPDDMVMIVQNGEIAIWNANSTKVERYKPVKWPDGSFSAIKIENS